MGETKTINPPVVYERVDALITCFRLFKSGYVGPSLVIGEAWTTEDQKEPFTFAFGYSARSPEGGLAYGLDLKEVPQLVNFSKEVAPLILSERFTSLRNPAFRFFNRGIDDMARSDYSVAVIDFVSCLESLVGVSPVELKHRLSEAIALISEREPSNRQKRYNEVKRLYDRRSEAVHGVDTKVSSDDAVLAEKLARYTLRFCLGYYSKGFDKKKIMEDLNNILFGTIKDFPDYAFKYINNEDMKNYIF